MVGNNSYGRIEIKVQSIPPPPPPPVFRSPHQCHPWLIPLFFNINIIIFIVSMYINNCPAHSNDCIGAQLLQRFAFENVRENPLFGPSTATLERMGALDAIKVIQERQQWRIVTCMWLHAGVFHIFANMLSLLTVGIRLEQEFGYLRIGSVYILSGIGGSMLSAVFIRKTISVGASGALFGLFGAMLSELLTNWTIYANKFAALTTLVLTILANLTIGIFPHVDNFAHIGGFVTGFLLGFILLLKPHFHWVNQGLGPFDYFGRPMKARYKIYQCIFFVLSTIALFTMFIIGFVFLFRKVNANDYCSWCHYLSCIPTPLWSCDPQCNFAALTTLVLTILANLTIGIFPHVDNLAHVGGFVTGFLLGFILLLKPHFHWVNQGLGPFDYFGRPMKARYKIYQCIFFVLSAIALFAMFTIGFVFLFRKVNANDYCSWCHYLSCIPTPLWSCDPQCNSTQSGNQLDLTCLNNGKSKSYMLPDDNDDLRLIRELCANLCI